VQRIFSTGSNGNRAKYSHTEHLSAESTSTSIKLVLFNRVTAYDLPHIRTHIMKRADVL